MEEDSEEISKIVGGLKKETGSDGWKAAEGFHVYPSIVFDALKNPKINLDSGMIVKLFVDDDTGEVRVYHWGKVKKS